MANEFKASNGIITPIIKLNASTTSAAPLSIPHGSAPSSPVNGDVWTTTDGAYARINGVTEKFNTISGDEVTKTYVDSNDFINLYPKAGLDYGDNELPVYSDYKFGLGAWSTNSFSYIDSRANHVVFFHARTPLYKYNVFRAYKISAHADFLYDNDPVSLNGLNSGEYVRAMFNMGTNFALLQLASDTTFAQTRVVIAKTNGSSKWSDWTLAYDVTSLASGTYNFSLVSTTSGDRILRLTYTGTTTVLDVYSTSLTLLRSQTLYTRDTDVDFTDNSGSGKTGASISFGYNPWSIAHTFTWNPFSQRLHQINAGYYAQTLASGAKQGVGYGLTIAWYVPAEWLANGTSSPYNLIPIKSGTYRYRAYSDSTWNTRDGGMSTDISSSGNPATIVTDDYTGNLHITTHGTWTSTSAGNVSIFSNNIVNTITRSDSSFDDSLVASAGLSIPDSSPWSKGFSASTVISIGNQISFTGTSTQYGSKLIYAKFSTTNFNSVGNTNNTLILDNTTAIIGPSFPSTITSTTSGLFGTTVLSGGTPVYYWCYPGKNVHTSVADGPDKVWTETSVAVPDIPDTIGATTSLVFHNTIVWNGSTSTPVFWALVKSNGTTYYMAKCQSSTWTIPGSSIMVSELATGNTTRGDTAYSATAGIGAVLLTESGRFIFHFQVPHVGGTVFYVSTYNTSDNTNSVSSWNQFNSKTGGNAGTYVSANGYGGASAGYSSTLGYYVAGTTSSYDALYIVSSKDVTGSGAEISENTWYTTASSRYEKWLTVQSTVGLVATLMSYPLEIGGYYLIVPTTTITLSANTTNYVYITKTDTDRTSVEVTAQTYKLPSSFKRLLIAEITTDSSNILSSITYAFSGNGLPTQTNNQDKVLMTDGKYSYWSDIPLPNQIVAVDNTYANAMLLSGPTRSNDATGDTWIFADSKGSDSNKYGIKHNQASNYIEFWGGNTATSYVDLTNGAILASGPIIVSSGTSSFTQRKFEGTSAYNVFSGWDDNGVYMDNNSNIRGYRWSRSSGATTLMTLDASGNLTATGDITAFSDERLKSNIATIQNPLEIIKGIKGVSYDRIDTGESSMGVIAQDLLPDLSVLVKETNDGTLSVNYNGLSAVFIEAIKELTIQVEQLKQEIKKLKGE
jgi:Chaperone of endosialidase